MEIRTICLGTALLGLLGVSTCAQNANSSNSTRGGRQNSSTNSSVFGATSTGAAASQEGITDRFAKGQRAFAIPVDEGSAVGGWTLPGSMVDVILTEPRRDDHGTRTSTILQNVRVIAGGGLNTKAIIVQLTPEEVQHVATALDTGHVRLSLRSASEGSGSVTLAPDSSEMPFIAAQR